MQRKLLSRYLVEHYLTHVYKKPAQVYVAPHYRFSRDIFGMWDAVAMGSDDIMFFALSSEENLSRTIKQHGLLCRKNYINTNLYVSYIIITYKKVRRKYRIRYYLINVTQKKCTLNRMEVTDNDKI